MASAQSRKSGESSESDKGDTKLVADSQCDVIGSSTRPHVGAIAPPTLNEKAKGFLMRFKFGLGISFLLPEWKRMLMLGKGGQWIARDLIGGFTLAAVAIPLSLAIAISSNVMPEVGLVTAIIGGLTAAFMGGTTLACTGPAAAMSVVVYQIVDERGLDGLLVVTLISGLVQVIVGVVRAGRVVKFMPEPVVAGFTMSIGLTIFINQIPAVLGAKPPVEYEIPLEKLFFFYEIIPYAQLTTVVLALLTVFIAMGMPKLMPKVPGAPVFAVAAATMPNLIFDLGAPIIGSLPESLPAPELNLPSAAKAISLIPDIILVFTIASLESLLSSTVADRICQDKEIPKHDSDQELIGQGLANMASSFFGGIPVTGVIARTSVNINVGAKTRRSSMFHALLLLVSVYALGPVMGQIPLCALAGILLGVAFRLMDPRAHLVAIYHANKLELIPFAVTAVVVLATDLLWGTFSGVVVSIIFAFISPPCGRPRLLKINSSDKVAVRRSDVEEASQESHDKPTRRSVPVPQDGFWWMTQSEHLPTREPQPPSDLVTRSTTISALQDFNQGFWNAATTAPAAAPGEITVGQPIDEDDEEAELEEIGDSESDVPEHVEEFWHVRFIEVQGDFTFLSAMRLDAIRKLLIEMPGTKAYKMAHNQRIDDKHDIVVKKKVSTGPSPTDTTAIITTTITTTTDTTVRERSRMRAIFDFTKVTRIDVSGAEQLLIAFHDFKEDNSGGSIILRGMSAPVKAMLVTLDHNHDIDAALKDVDNIF